MEDIIDIIVTETTNLIEITSQPTDEIIDVNIIDNREDVTLNVTPTLVEININSLTGNFGILWGEIEGTLSNQTDLNTALGLKADLVDGKVPSSQLPSYVDDVVEVANYASLPVTGEVGKIYITLDTNFIYRWTGSVYVEIKDSSAVWGAITGTLSNQTDLQNALNAKQDDLNGTGFVKASGTSISYDNSTYLTTSAAASTYLPLSGGSISGLLTVSTLNGLVYADATGQLGTTQGTTDTIAYWSSARTVASLATTTYPSLTELSYVKGVTSAIQTQLNSKQNALTNPVTGTGTSGIVAVFNGTSSITDSTIYANSTRVSIGADVTTTNRFTAVASTSNSYAVVAQASGAANGFWATLTGTGEIFRGQTAGGSYFIINNGGNAFLNGNLNVGDFASTSYRLNVVGTANFTGALSGTSATFSGNVTIRPSTGYNAYFQTSGTSVRINYLNDALSANVGAAFRATDYSFQDSTGSPILTIASTGATTFSSSVDVNSYIRNTNVGANAAVTIAADGTSHYIQSTNAARTIYNNLLLNPYGAKVGIGTTSPSGRLHILNASGTGQPALELQQSNSGSNILQWKGSLGSYLGIISDAGNVGIGTTTISQNFAGYTHLDIGNATTGGILLFSNASGTNYGYVNGEAGGVNMRATVGNLTFNTGATERMRITSGGTLLVNATSANGYGGIAPKLEVYGTSVGSSDSDGGTLALLGNTNTADAGGALVLGGTTTSFYATWGRIRAPKDNATSGNYAGGLAFDTRQNSSNFSERMRITSGGNVGIGTSSPNLTATNRTTLDINGTTSSLLGLSVGGNARAYLYHSGTNFAIANYANGGNLDFNTYGTDGDNTRMRITSGGNVGIGVVPQGVGTAKTLEIGSRGLIYDNNDNFAYVNNAYNDGSWRYKQTGYATILSTDSGNFVFSNAPSGSQGSAISFSERMRLDTGGNMIHKAYSVGQGILMNYSGGATYGFYNNNSGALTLTNSGVANVGSFNMSTGIYTPTSDKNKKKDFEDSTIGLNEVIKLKPTLYRMKTDESNGIKELGFIAQEVKEIIPNAYVENEDFIGLNFNPIVAALTKAIQEQQVQIQELKEQLASK